MTAGDLQHSPWRVRRGHFISPDLGSCARRHQCPRFMGTLMVRVGQGPCRQVGADPRPVLSFVSSITLCSQTDGFFWSLIMSLMDSY